MKKDKKYADDAPLTATEMKTARPMREAMPELLDSIKRSRGRPVGRTKEVISLSLDVAVTAALRASGRGWQTRANQILRKALHLPASQKHATRA